MFSHNRYLERNMGRLFLVSSTIKRRVGSIFGIAILPATARLSTKCFMKKGDPCFVLLIPELDTQYTNIPQQHHIRSPRIRMKNSPSGFSSGGGFTWEFTGLRAFQARKNSCWEWFLANDITKRREHCCNIPFVLHMRSIPLARLLVSYEPLEPMQARAVDSPELLGISRGPGPGPPMKPAVAHEVCQQSH